MIGSEKMRYGRKNPPLYVRRHLHPSAPGVHIHHGGSFPASRINMSHHPKERTADYGCSSDSGPSPSKRIRFPWPMRICVPRHSVATTCVSSFDSRESGAKCRRSNGFCAECRRCSAPACRRIYTGIWSCAVGRTLTGPGADDSCVVFPHCTWTNLRGLLYPRRGSALTVVHAWSSCSAPPLGQDCESSMR